MSAPDEPLRIRQFAEFSIQSTVISADAMTEALGLQPDSLLVRGSRTASPPRPVWHGWTLRAEHDADLGQQVEALVGRLQPVKEALQALIERIESDPEDYGLLTDQRGGAVLSLVRYFQDEAAEPDRLGWHLSPDVLSFLSDLGASLDVDEYAG